MACSKLEARGHLLHKTSTPPKHFSRECKYGYVQIYSNIFGYVWICSDMFKDVQNCLKMFDYVSTYMPRILYVFEEKINKNLTSFITVHCHGSWWMRLHVTFPPPTGCVMSNLTDSYNHYFYRDVNTKYYLASQKEQNIAWTTDDGCMMRKWPAEHGQ